mmetsp:Transcript_22025/g.60987  ORF Transcript_22025/g.60987 Transcript_22025/m.60987 type:complete len:250 (+) Transcript_22025:2652-3401(+)
MALLLACFQAEDGCKWLLLVGGAYVCPFRHCCSFPILHPRLGIHLSPCFLSKLGRQRTGEGQGHTLRGHAHHSQSYGSWLQARLLARRLRACEAQLQRGQRARSHACAPLTAAAPAAAASAAAPAGTSVRTCCSTAASAAASCCRWWRGQPQQPALLSPRLRWAAPQQWQAVAEQAQVRPVAEPWLAAVPAAGTAQAACTAAAAWRQRCRPGAAAAAAAQPWRQTQSVAGRPPGVESLRAACTERRRPA